MLLSVCNCFLNYTLTSLRFSLHNLKKTRFNCEKFLGPLHILTNSHTKERAVVLQCYKFIYFFFQARCIFLADFKDFKASSAWFHFSQGWCSFVWRLDCFPIMFKASSFQQWAIALRSEKSLNSSFKSSDYRGDRQKSTPKKLICSPGTNFHYALTFISKDTCLVATLTWILQAQLSGTEQILVSNN